MPKSIHERVRATLARQEAARRKVDATARNRRLGGLAAADTRAERSMARALDSGIASNEREQRAIDRELFGMGEG